MASSLNIEEIMNFLPHRYPFLLIDKVADYEEGKWLKAIKNVTINEPFFNGHFPGQPVMPGVLLLEALAQAGCMMAYLSMDQAEVKNYIFFLASIEGAKFKQIVAPGDQLELNVTMGKNKGSFWRIEGEASVAGKLVCSASFLSAMRKVNS